MKCNNCNASCAWLVVHLTFCDELVRASLHCKRIQIHLNLCIRFDFELFIGDNDAAAAADDHNSNRMLSVQLGTHN